MPNPELNISQAEQTNAKNSELSGSILRQINQVRGEKTYEAERSQRDKETLERIAKLRQELEAIHKKKIELGILSPDTPFVFNEEDYIPTKSSPNLSTAQSAKTSVAPELPSSPAQKNTEPASAEEGEPLNTSPNHVVPAQANSEAAIANSEKDSQQAEKNEFKEKLKKKSGLKKVLTVVAAAALAGLVFAGLWLGFNSGKKQNNPQETQPATEYVEVITDTGEDQETKGIYDGYGEKGMWLSKNKGGAYDFASAKEVAEVCDNNEREMIKYAARNQVESFADYLANLPEELQPNGFKGLTILEAEKKLEGLSDDEYEAVKNQFGEIIDSAFTRDVVLNGTYHNAYMQLIDQSKPATHENMELVECITQENGTRAKEFYWTDDGTANGKIIGKIIVKIIYDENGKIIGGCLQAVQEEGSPYTVIYTDMKEIKENPPAPPEKPAEAPSENPSEAPSEASTENPTESPTEAPTEAPTEPPTEAPTEAPPETPAPKNTEAEKENAGPRAGQQPLDEAVTPKTTLEEDKANFAQIKKQQEENAARAAEAKRVATEQAERERRAAEEARDLQAKLERASVYYEAAGDTEAKMRADEAAARASREALSADQIAAELEAAAERAERESAQSEANPAAETMSSGAEEMGTYTTSEKNSLFEQLFGGQ